MSKQHEHYYTVCGTKDITTLTKEYTILIMYCPCGDVKEVEVAAVFR